MALGEGKICEKNCEQSAMLIIVQGRIVLAFVGALSSPANPTYPILRAAGWCSC